MRTTGFIVTVVVAVSLAACSSSPSSSPTTTSGSASNSSTTTTAATSSTTGSTGNTGNTGNTGSPSCAATSSEVQPSASLVSTAVGMTLTGPTHTGGVAPCVYTTANNGQNAGGIEVNILYNPPATASQFASQSASAVGGPANLHTLSGVGEQAYYSTANTQDEVFVMQSSSVNFSVVVNTANDTPEPINLTQCEDVAKALVAS
jgi:hypothetical protein